MNPLAAGTLVNVIDRIIGEKVCFGEPLPGIKKGPGTLVSRDSLGFQ